MLVGDWRLLPQRMALHPPSGTAVAADLHLGYREARQRKGDAIPSLPLDFALAPIRQARDRWPFHSLVVAGDLFEAGFDPELYRRFCALLASWGIEFLGLAPGNHDRGLTAEVRLWPSDGCIGGWRVCHEDDGGEGRKVLGHWHPCVRQRGRKLPCFLADGQTLVLPAFSRDAAGVDVRGDARWQAYEIYAIHNDQIEKPG